jgi:hypothetical protein
MFCAEVERKPRDMKSRHSASTDRTVVVVDEVDIDERTAERLRSAEIVFERNGDRTAGACGPAIAAPATLTTALATGSGTRFVRLEPVAETRVRKTARPNPNVYRFLFGDRPYISRDAPSRPPPGWPTELDGRQRRRGA